MPVQVPNNPFFYVWRFTRVANKKRAKPGDKDYGKVTFRGFVNVYLKPHEKAQIKAQLLEAPALIIFLEELCANGYKFSLTRSVDDKFYTATAYCTDFRKANAGYGLSQRHSDSVVAVSALQWCFGLEGFDGDWEAVWGAGSDDDW